MQPNGSNANHKSQQGDKPLPVVLIAEREAIVAADLAACLEGTGRYKVLSALTTEKAMALAMEHQPDVLIMDDTLGSEEQAIDTAMKIKVNLRIPVIMALSSTHPRAIYNIEHTLNPIGMIRKPADDKALLECVDCALRGERSAYTRALFHHLSI